MLKQVTNFIFKYETEKVIQVHSWKIGLLFRFVQLCIVVYFVFWVIIKERGYQSMDHGVSGIIAKVHGISYADGFEKIYQQKLWDAADYVIPPLQNSAFFITTNLVVTRHQLQSKCADFLIPNNTFFCETDADCVAGKLGLSGQNSGRCIATEQLHTNDTVKVCEIYGWCPTERNVLPMEHNGLILNAPNFTVLIKNNVDFPAYGAHCRNILSWMKPEFFENCAHNSSHHQLKYCPIFRLGDILYYTHSDTSDMWIRGGMMSIHIQWECDLDYPPDTCHPQYSFHRLDSHNEKVAAGVNFRYAYRSVGVDGSIERTLIKAYGIQFFISVQSKAYKFDWYTLTMNIGSGLGLLGIATVICDIVLLNLLKERGIYEKAKNYKVHKRRNVEHEETEM